MHANLSHMKDHLAHINRIFQEYESVKPSLSEKERRLWAAKQAQDYGYGGIALVCQAIGISNSTIHKGLKELKNPSNIDPSRSRKPGGGRKDATQKLPNIHQAITALMKPDYREDQDSPFLWTLHDTLVLSKRIKLAGFPISSTKLGELLKKSCYYLRPSQRPGRYPSSKDRDGQCRRIWMTAQKCVEAQIPLLFVDVREHPIDESLLPQTPATSCLFPCEDMLHHKGWAFVGVKENNTAFVLQTFQTWWKDIGKGAYPNADVITLIVNGYDKERKSEGLMDACPWPQALQQLAHDSGLSIRVRHLPPCTFRWNNILHKTTTYSIVGDKIMAVTLYAIGLSGKPTVVSSFWDSRQPPALPVPGKVHIKRDKFHPEWNYGVEVRD